MPPVSVLMKPASSMCNMKCSYCFYCDEACKRKTKSYGFMSEETLKNVIRKTMLRADQSISFTYQGGEPTLRGMNFFKKAAALEQQYNKKNLMIQHSFQTNGYAVDEKWCRFFKENDYLVGLSVDGTKTIHDACRRDAAGKGTYDCVVRAAKLMDEHEVPYNILTVVTSSVARNIKEIYYDYKEKGWNYQQYIACLDPSGEVRGKASYSLTPKLYGQFLIELFQLWYRDVKRGKQPYIRQFDAWVGMMAGYMPECCDQRGVCGIQNVVEADGSVYPCDFYMMDEYYLGNFNHDRLEDIDCRRREIQFTEKSLEMKAKCRECKYYRLCRGGCRRNFDWDGNTGTYENYFCESYKMFFEVCGEKLKELAGYNTNI